MEYAYEAGWNASIDAMVGALTLSQSEIRLMCGELTAAEMRAVKAMLDSRRAAILDRKIADEVGRGQCRHGTCKSPSICEAAGCCDPGTGF